MMKLLEFLSLEILKAYLRNVISRFLRSSPAAAKTKLTNTNKWVA